MPVFLEGIIRSVHKINPHFVNYMIAYVPSPLPSIGTNSVSGVGFSFVLVHFCSEAKFYNNNNAKNYILDGISI